VLFGENAVVVPHGNDAVLLYIRHHLYDRLSRVTCAHLRVMMTSER